MIVLAIVSSNLSVIFSFALYVMMHSVCIAFCSRENNLNLYVCAGIPNLELILNWGSLLFILERKNYKNSYASNIRFVVCGLRYFVCFCIFLLSVLNSLLAGEVTWVCG